MQRYIKVFKLWGPLLEKFWGSLRSFGGPANLESTRLINIRWDRDHWSGVEPYLNLLISVYKARCGNPCSSHRTAQAWILKSWCMANVNLSPEYLVLIY